MHIKQSVDSDAERLPQLVSLFHQLFAEQYNIRLVGGASEPLYQPADADNPVNILYFREDYLSSALHEIAHWAIAGEERRKLLDFGYWYEPEGRSAEQQREFELVEVAPQALEWHLSVACKQRFRVSADNLQAGIGASELFLQRVADQARNWCAEEGMPLRGEQFCQCLAEHFGVADHMDEHYYQRQLLT